MSNVPEGKRGKQELEVDTKAQRLHKYVEILCQNEKKFYPSDGINYCWLGNKMLAASADLLCYIRMANKINVADDDRTRLQLNALAKTEQLLALGQIAYENGVLKSKSVKTYTQWIIDVKDLIVRWRKSDKERNLKSRTDKKSSTGE